MSEKTYLANVLDVKEIVESAERKFCIISGVGSGKNYFIENVLSQYGNILYISSRRAKVDEILFDGLANTSINWRNTKNDVVSTTNFGIEKLVKNEKFGVHPFDHVLSHFDFIVVDEAHSMYTDIMFADSSFHVKALIDYVANCDRGSCKNIKIVLMTGTPEPIRDMLEEEKYKIFDLLGTCVNVIPQNIQMVSKEKAIILIQNLPQDQQTIYYSNSATKLIEGKNSMYKRLTAGNGVVAGDIGFSMSDTKAAELSEIVDGLQDACKKLKKYISEHKKLPRDKRILLTTSTLKEGINITKGNIKVAFCETHVLSDIQQFAGRVRQGLDTLYIVEDAPQHTVTTSDLNRAKMEMLWDREGNLAEINKFFSQQVLNGTSQLYKDTGYSPISATDLNFYYEQGYSLATVGGEAVRDYIELTESAHKYIRFNHITGEFELNTQRLHEEERICGIFQDNKWFKELRSFTEQNNITFIQESIDSKKLLQYLKKYQDQAKVGKVSKNMLATIRELLCLKKNCKITTINNALIQQGLPYQIRNDLVSKNNKRQRAKMIVAIEAEK